MWDRLEQREIARRGLRPGPGDRPRPDLPVGSDLIPQIKHIVILMMENHSYDNYLGMLTDRGEGLPRGADGTPTAVNTLPDGRRFPAHHLTSTRQLKGNPTQSWRASNIAYDNGTCNGFSASVGVCVPGADPGVPMGCWTDEDLPFYYGLARTFPVALRRLAQIWRWLPQVVKGVQANKQFTAALYPLGLARAVTHLRTTQRFVADAAAGKLPAVSLVDPGFESFSEENPQDITRGESFAAAVINAVMHGPAWESTLLLWIYDEHGGYYDHVPPPPAVAPDDIGPLWPATAREGFARYGFRVPAVVVSAWAKPVYVSSMVYDHTSILATVERKWNLPPLTRRDEAATSPLGALDLEASPKFLTPPTLPGPQAEPFSPSSRSRRSARRS